MDISKLNVYILGDSISYIGGAWSYQLKEYIGCKAVYNLALGGATFRNRDDFICYDSSSPIYRKEYHPLYINGTEYYSPNGDGKYNNPRDCGPDNPISNQIRFMNRLIQEYHHPIPDVIIISCGINDTNSKTHPYTEEAFLKVMEEEVDYSSMEGGMKNCLEEIKRRYPAAIRILGTPIPSAYSFLEPYIPNTRNWILAFAHAYDAEIVDAFLESEIRKEEEAGKEDIEYNPNNPGRYLFDGLHPNAEGNKKMGQCYGRRIKDILCNR